MSAATTEPSGRAAPASSTAVLRRIAGYVLPPALDRRILDLAERKESLTPDERAEWLAWVAFTQQRSIEKVEAEVALRRLAEAFPESAGGVPAADVLGIGAGDGPPPDDATVERWERERKMQKYA